MEAKRSTVGTNGSASPAPANAAPNRDEPRPTLGRLIAPAAAAIPISIVLTTAVVIHFAPTQAFNMPAEQGIAFVFVANLIAGIVSVAMTLRYRMPILCGISVSALVFAASLAGQMKHSDVLGAMMVAGVVIALLGVFNVSKKVSAWIPAPIVMAMLAGLIMPMVSGIFTAVDVAPIPVLAGLAVYFGCRRFASPKLPPVLPALTVLMALSWLTGALKPGPVPFALPSLQPMMPTFSAPSLLAITPVFVIIVLIQHNLAASVILRKEGYEPPSRLIDVVTGLGTALGSFFGVCGISMTSPVTQLTAGPEAGDRDVRPWSVLFSSVSFFLVAILAASAWALLNSMPLILLRSLTGFALLAAFVGFLQQSMRGPLVFGPAVAFAISMSKISLLGLSPSFWSLLLGLAISYCTERDKLEPAAPVALSSVLKR